MGRRQSSLTRQLRSKDARVLGFSRSASYHAAMQEAVSMTWNTAIKWIMLVSGALTLTMVYAAIAPEAAMRTTFGEAPAGALAEIVVRNWGVLVGLVGVMLIYGANRPQVRPLVLMVAGVSKLAFIGLVLFYGQAVPHHGGARDRN